MTLAVPGLWYASMEDVKAALDIKLTARSDGQVRDALESSSNTVESLLHRRFYPWTGTRYFDWPRQDYSRSWRLWLGANEAISATALTAAGETIAASDYFLRRSDDLDEPPYSHLEIDLASSAAFAAGSTHQRQLALTGKFGYRDDETSAGTITANISSTTATSISLSNSAVVGIGHLIRIDDERMIVTAKAMVDTGQNCTTLAASEADVSITGITAGSIHVGETILVDSERMLVVDVAGTTVTVKRRHDGTVLAAHTNGADIYAPRTATVLRGQVGTTAATHDSADVIWRHMPPGVVQKLQVAEALNILLQELSGYAREVGSGENAREASGRGLKQIREDAYTAVGRKARKAAI